MQVTTVSDAMLTFLHTVKLPKSRNAEGDTAEIRRANQIQHRVSFLRARVCLAAVPP